MKIVETNKVEKGQTLFVLDNKTNLRGYVEQFVEILSVEDGFAVIQFAKTFSVCQPDTLLVKLSEWTFAETGEEFQAAALGQDYWASEICVSEKE